jgi:hypothetical protein
MQAVVKLCTLQQYQPADNINRIVRELQTTQSTRTCEAAVGGKIRPARTGAKYFAE